jgi:hypothetical protein
MPPVEAWRVLLRRAYRIIDSCRAAHVPEPEWSLGGGTALMLALDHRESRDVDIFLGDPQYVTFFSPRLNDIAEELAADYVEQSNFLKLSFPEGEIDIIVAPRLTLDPFEVRELEGRLIRVERAAEIIAKKLFYRADQLKARDLFDLAAALDRWPQLLGDIQDLVAPKADALRARLEDPPRQFREDFARLERRRTAAALDFDAARRVVLRALSAAGRRRR